MWFPPNYLVATALQRYHEFFGNELTIEYPTGSGTSVTLDVVAADIWERLVSIVLVDRNGGRPCFGDTQRMQSDPWWRDNLSLTNTSTATTVLALVRRTRQAVPDSSPT